MPWKPKCCNSTMSKIVNGLKFDKVIKIQYRVQVKSFAVNQGTEWQVVDIISTFANIKTKSTPILVDGVNRGFSQSHIFTIRYSPILFGQLLKLQEEHWILYNDTRYKVLTQENIDEEGTLIRLIANVRGSDDIEINKS